jgi:hypothetical protein
MPADVYLEKALDALRLTYKNIDIRAFVGRSQNKWQCIFLKIRLTHEEKEEVEKQYENMKRDLDVKNDGNFQLLAKCRPIEDLNSILTELSEGRFIIQQILLEIEENEIRSCMRLPIQKYGQSYETNSEYKHWFIFVHHRDGASTHKIAQDLGFVPEEIGLDFYSVYQWFNIPSDEWNRLSLKVILLLPVYVKRVETVSKGNGGVNIVYAIHKEFLSVLDFPRVILHKASHKVSSYNGKLESPELQDAASSDIVNRIVSIDPSVVSELDSTEVWMIHKPLKFTIYNDRIIRDEIFSTAGKEEIATQEQPIVRDSIQKRGEPTIVVGDYVEGDKYGGDKFSDIKDSTIINKSLVVRSWNEI